MSKRVIFVKSTNFASSKIGCDQRAWALRRQGLDSDSIHSVFCNNITDSILIVGKFCLGRGLLKKLRKKGNIIVFATSDILVHPRWEIYWPGYDGVIFYTSQSQKDFGHLVPRSWVIPPCWDSDLLINYRDLHTDNHLRMGYIGLESNCLHLNQLDIGNTYDFMRAAFYNCHISIRETGSVQANYKPAQKVVTAAAVNANIITTRDSGAMDLLPQNYPFFVKPTLDAVKNMIVHVSKIFGKEEWHYGLSCMDTVRRKSTPDTIAKQIVKIVKELENV